MLVFAAALFSSSLLAQSIWKEPKKQSWKTATGAEQHERLLWDAVKSKDWLAVVSHVSSNFVYLNSLGTQDKAQWVQQQKSEPLSEFRIDDVNVIAQGADAIVTYRLTSKAANGTDSAVRMMSVWQQQKSGWVLVSRAVTCLVTTS